MPERVNYAGWRMNPHTRELFINKEGVDVAEVTPTGIAVTGDVSVSGVLTAGSVVDNGVIDGPVTVNGDFTAEGTVNPLFATDASADEVGFFGGLTGQAAHVANVTVTGDYAADDTAIETAINSIIAVLEAYGLTATS